MNRIYRERKYKCGEYLEVSVYPVYAKAKGRGKRRKPTSEIQKRLNRQHSANTLRRLLHTNFTSSDLFVTLTFNDESLPETPEDCQRLMQNFLRRAKRKYGKLGLELKYIYIIEYGEKHNRLHIHIVMSKGISRTELAKLWGLGTVSAETLRFESDGLSALAVYLTKSGEADNRTTWKRWSGSRNLEKPIMTERDGRLSHKKMRNLCLDKGDYEYLETQYIGYEMANNVIDISEDIFGGLYLSAMLKKMSITKNQGLPFWASPDLELFNF